MIYSHVTIEYTPAEHAMYECELQIASIFYDNTDFASLESTHDDILNDIKEVPQTCIESYQSGIDINMEYVKRYTHTDDYIATILEKL